jgi:hypothetical protein
MRSARSAHPEDPVTGQRSAACVPASSELAGWAGLGWAGLGGLGRGTVRAVRVRPPRRARCETRRFTGVAKPKRAAFQTPGPKRGVAKRGVPQTRRITLVTCETRRFTLVAKRGVFRPRVRNATLQILRVLQNARFANFTFLLQNFARSRRFVQNVLINPFLSS